MNQKFVTIIAVNPKTDDQAEAIAEQQVQDFTAFGIEAKLLDSEVYPEMLLTSTNATPVQPAFMVYVGPFDTEQDAADQCDPIQHDTGAEFCTSAQPDP